MISTVFVAHSVSSYLATKTICPNSLSAFARTINLLSSSLRIESFLDGED
jgi:hypothetical protein